MKISLIQTERKYKISICEDALGPVQITIGEPDGHKAYALLTLTEVRELVEVLGPFHA